MTVNFKPTQNLKKKKNKPYLRQIASLFDGDHFGEMALIDLEQKEDISQLGPPKKRKAHCISSDHSFMLEVPHDACIRAYQATGAKDMKERLEFLLGLPGFRQIDKNTLLPLASNLKIKKYRMGEYLVRQREMPSGLIIIKSGECLVGYEKQRRREFHNNIYTKLKPKEMNSHFNNFSDARYETTSGFNSKTVKLKAKTSQALTEAGEVVQEIITKRTFK